MKHHSRSIKFQSSKFTIVFLLLAFISSLVTFADDNSRDLSVEQVKAAIRTDSGIDQLIDMLQKDEAYIKADKPFYYHYISGIKALAVDYDFKTADKQFRMAQEEAAKHTDAQQEALALKGIIDVNSYYGDITILVDFGNKLMKLGDESDQPDMAAIGAYSIALGHYYIYDDSKVEEYLKLGFEKASKVNNLSLMAQYYSLMGDLRYGQKDYQAAREYFNRALETLKNASNEDRAVRELNIRSHALSLIMDSMEGKPKEQTIGKFTKLLEAELAYNKYNMDILINLYQWNADIYRNYKMQPGAVKCYENSLELGGKITHIDNNIDPFDFTKKRLAEAYYEIGEYEKSAALYVGQARFWENQAIIEKNESDINQVKGLGEQQLSETVGQLNTLKKLDEEKITAQERALIVSIVFITLMAAGLVLIGLEHKRVLSLKKTIYLQSITDSLTQIYNRGKIIEVLEKDLQADNMIAIIDIDDFKIINDTYGHAVGDEVIVGIVSAIKKSLRSTDVLGRYGGEEFILVLKHVTDSDAQKIIERVRKDVEEIQWPYTGLNTTVSIGMMKKSGLNPQNLFVEVDKLLYEAKKNGKNRVVYGNC